MRDEPTAKGTLFVVATPIGNRADLSRRAQETLAAAAVVACEDTRRTGALLSSLGIRARLRSLHEHNEAKRVDDILGRLDAGDDVALVSDAGTPLLSDPGFLVVRAAVAAGHRVQPVPGPSAILAALSVSGLPPYPFTFVGFPPPKAGKRRSFLARWAELPHSLVLFESPHRILKTLDDARDVLGDRQAFLGRELTKLHEESLRGSLGEIRERLAERDTIKGEIVLVVAGRSDDYHSPRLPAVGAADGASSRK